MTTNTDDQTLLQWLKSDGSKSTLDEEPVRSHFPRLQSRRSTATKKEDPGEDEELNQWMRILARRSFFLHNKRGRAVASRAEHGRIMRHEQFWAKVKRAEARLSISMTDVPKRKRALERIYADLVAENAYNLTSSLAALREIYSATDQRDMLRFLGEDVQRMKAFHKAKWQAVSSYQFAPLGDFGFFRQLGKLLDFVGHFPLFLLDNIMAVVAFFARKNHNSQLKVLAHMRSLKSVEKDKSNSKDANMEQHPVRSGKGDSRRLRRK